jgi:hypothetical protein
MGTCKPAEYHLWRGLTIVSYFQPTKNVQNFTAGQQLLLVRIVLDYSRWNDFGGEELLVFLASD